MTKTPIKNIGFSTPYSAIVEIVSSSSTTTSTIGTGFLIDKNTILTNGHVVYGNSSSLDTVDLTIRMGRDWGMMPKAILSDANFKVNPAYVSPQVSKTFQNAEQDYAVISLNMDVSFLTDKFTFSLQNQWSGYSSPIYAHYSGYGGNNYKLVPGAPNVPLQAHNEGYVTKFTGSSYDLWNDDVLDHTKGDSGSPIYTVSADGKYNAFGLVVATTTDGTDIGIGVALTEDDISRIKGWASADDSLITTKKQVWGTVGSDGTMTSTKVPITKYDHFDTVESLSNTVFFLNEDEKEMAHLYKTVIGDDIDPDILDLMCDVNDMGWTDEHIADVLLTSHLFTDKFGTALSEEEFIDTIYTNVTNKTASSAELNLLVDYFHGQDCVDILLEASHYAGITTDKGLVQTYDATIFSVDSLINTEVYFYI